MSTAIHAEDCLTAWRDASQSVLTNERSMDNLIVTIENPIAIGVDWIGRYDPAKISPSAKSCRTVINTIFPMQLAEKVSSRQDLYNRHFAILAHARARGNREIRWGGYFSRLTRCGLNGVNQLESAIEKLNTWPKSFKAAL